ncbi:uncharacterized protein LOC109835924 [Asparagus officinalis]|uniref:uncharacterized protein LOC109835924 n=1 Tax=Asparagus officinalis TaxID=4686 RepID=UPI00098E7764|nr:uncharacterized protein LOC109835924 [Asparagus officinalis]
MMLKLPFLFIFLSFSLLVDSKPTSNNVTVTVIGSVFCDSCSDNAFSKRSYFLEGARVQIQCSFKANSMFIAANTTTDQYGVYKLNIPRLTGFRCRQGQVKKSQCQAVLIESPSSFCNVMGIRRSTTQITIKPRKSRLCILNLNTMNYKPPKRDVTYCGAIKKPQTASLDSSLFFWPLIPPFLLPWLRWPPLPFAFPPLPFPFNSIPLPDPSSLPFSLPPWLLPFLDPSSLPFPFSLFPPMTMPPNFPTPPPFPPERP